MLIGLIAAFFGTMGFAMITNVRGKGVIFASLGGALSWGLYLLFYKWLGATVLAVFAAATLSAVYSEIMARLFKIPAIVFTYCAVICLVPGSGMYYSMQAAISNDDIKFISKVLETLMSAGAIAAGIALVSSISSVFRILTKNRLLQK